MNKEQLICFITSNFNIKKERPPEGGPWLTYLQWAKEEVKKKIAIRILLK